jgi:hypothetical protein
VKELSKGKFSKLTILGIVLIVVIVLFYNFRNLVIYTQDTNGDIVSKSSVVYQFNGGLTSSFSGGELKADKVIGRFEGQNFLSTYFLGPRVVKLKDYDGKDTFLVSGIMLQAVYTIKDK